MACSSRNQGEEMVLRDTEQGSLFEACKHGDLELIKKLLTPDKVNMRDVVGRKSTPLHFAAGKSPKSGENHVMFIVFDLHTSIYRKIIPKIFNMIYTCTAQAL